MNLSTEVAGISLKNPLMPASGPLTGDHRKMLALEAMGVGAMVTKTISTVAAKVPRPCIVADKDFVINTELWSEFPPDMWFEEFLPQYKKSSSLPLIVSLGYSPEDLRKLVPLFSRFADAFELSTHYVADDPSLMKELVSAVKEGTDKPVFLKFDPSVPDPAEMAKAVQDSGGDGIVAINSLGPVYPLDRRVNRSFLGSSDGFGWISGPVIKKLSLSSVRRIREGCSLPIIGVGGIQSADDVIDFLSCGASAVQMLSGALIKGKDLFKRIVDALPSALEKRGFDSVIDAIDSAEIQKESFEVRNPLIDHEKCTRCGLCVAVCPYFALRLDDKVEVDPSECFGCGLCESRCPVSAIGGVLV